jgi:hypothetical protein
MVKLIEIVSGIRYQVSSGQGVGYNETMKTQSLIIAAIFFALGFGIAYFQMGGEFKMPAGSNQNGNQDSTQVVLSTPQPGDTIASPVTVSGQALGTWFFEASFPIKVTDNSGNQLGIGIATAQADWMTTGFVPFTANIVFNPGANTQGKLVLMKDNPSGLPANDDSIEIPVQF